MYVNLQFFVLQLPEKCVIHNYNRDRPRSDAFDDPACLLTEVKAAGVPGLGEDAEDLASLIICFDLSCTGSQ